MKILLAIFASLVSGIGGHFVNRRWDRALFFLGLGFVLYVVNLAFLFGDDQPNSWPGLSPESTIFTPPVMVFIGIWVLSILVTIYDAVRPVVEYQHTWTKQGVFGALITSLIVMFPLGVFSWTALASIWIQHEIYQSANANYESYSFSNNHFSKYIYFGHLEGSRSNLPEPSKGDLYISGQFLFEGQPVPGIDLTVILNGEFRTSNLTTDQDGFFHIRVPSSDWHVTIIEVEGWKDAPENADDFSVIKPNESIYTPGETYYRMRFMGESPGIPIAATTDPGEKPLSLKIVRNIKINWPTEDGDSVNASVDKDSLNWEAAPSAERYLAKIWRIERNGSRTSFYPTVSKDVQDTSLPLSELTVSTNSQDQTEYKVEVFAFDKEGNFLGQSAEHSSDASFTLTDGIALVEDMPGSNRSVSPEFSQQEINEFAKNNERLDTADFLIEDGLFDEAMTVLKKVKGKSEPGRLLALQGYLNAAQGDCDTANQLFNDAIAEGESNCVRKRYRANCSAN